MPSKFTPPPDRSGIRLLGFFAILPTLVAISWALQGAAHGLRLAREWAADDAAKNLSLVVAWCPTDGGDDCGLGMWLPWYVEDLHDALNERGVPISWPAANMLSALEIPAIISPSAIAGLLALCTGRWGWLVVAGGWFVLLFAGLVAAITLGE